MHFATRIVRPPFEARSTFLQVTTGCSHNKCRFCSYYKNIPFTISNKDHIKEDLKELRDSGNSFKRIWLQGADPFGLDCDRLCEIASLIHEYLPFVQSIGAYARVDSLKNKSVKDLKRLKRKGYESIVFGVESGDDNILNSMNKGYDSQEIIPELSKMDEAQIKYTLIFLSGLGGHDYGNSHAIKTAQIFNKLHPERIMINELMINKNTPLYDDVSGDRFVETYEKEKILELIKFLEELDVETFIDATNASVITPFFGKFPENRQAMIKHLIQIHQTNLEKDLHKKREKVNRTLN